VNELFINRLVIEITILVICVVLGAFFSLSESALFSLTKSDIHRFSHSNNARERSIYRIMKDPQKILITILTGNLFVSLIISMLSAKLLLKIWKDWGHVISIALVTPLIIVACEISPKIMAINSYEAVAKRILPLLQFFHRLLLPVRLVLLLFTDTMIRIFRLKLTYRKISKEELGLAVRLGEKHGVIGKAEGIFINNVIRFSKMDASNIMFPRNSAVFIPYGMSLRKAMKIFLESGVIRIPVYRGDLDHVVGMVDSRELIPYYLGYKKARNINRFIQEIHFYPASRELHELLNDFLSEGIQIAIVLDEYGGTAGVVTLNKILSELMGRDMMKWEDDTRHDIRRMDGTSSIVSGEMLIDDFNNLFGEDLERQNADSIGGYIIEKVSYIPKRGEELRTSKYILRVRYIKKNKIETVEVIRRTGAGGVTK
jgi:putative hemolysin